MSIPDPTVELRPYGGSAVREKPVLDLPVGVHDGRAKVTPIRMNRGPVKFSIDVTWRGGPMMDGFPPMPLEQWHPDADPPQRHEMYLTDDLELAKAIAQAAIDTLRGGGAPDLRAIKRSFEPGGAATPIDMGPASAA